MRTAVDTGTARTRLEGMLLNLDRSIAILKGEHPDPGDTRFDKHPADAGANLSDADRVEASLEAMEHQRGEVLAAMDRLLAGSYGECLGCGKPVPDGRLEARPEAARCVNCQSKYDRAHR